MAKQLGKVPIPGAEVEIEGLHADGGAAVRPPQPVGTVLVTAGADRRPQARPEPPMHASD